MKTKKPETIAKLKKRAWGVFSKWIRKRDDYICFTCGKDLKGSVALHAGHYISKRHPSTMFDERNVHAQCMYCNMWDYGNMGNYTLNLIDKYGLGVIRELVDKSKIPHSFTRDELEGIIEKYQ
jgi:hypothetical protein